MSTHYQQLAGTDRSHRLGKLDMAMHALVVGTNPRLSSDSDRYDLRIRVNDTREDIAIAIISLENRIPDELFRELQAISRELDELRPFEREFPKDHRIFGGGAGKNAKIRCAALAQRIAGVVVDIDRFDAVASLQTKK